MGYVIGAVAGILVLAALIWLRKRISLRLGGDERDRLRTLDQAQSEAETLTRSKNPYF